MKAPHLFEMSATTHPTNQCLIPHYLNHHFTMFSVSTEASYVNVNECVTKLQNWAVYMKKKFKPLTNMMEWSQVSWTEYCSLSNACIGCLCPVGTSTLKFNIYILLVLNTVSEQMTVTVCWLYIKVACRFYSLHCGAKKDTDSVVLLLVLETRI